MQGTGSNEEDRQWYRVTWFEKLASLIEVGRMEKLGFAKQSERM